MHRESNTLAEAAPMPGLSGFDLSYGPALALWGPVPLHDNHPYSNPTAERPFSRYITDR